MGSLGRGSGKGRLLAMLVGLILAVVLWTGNVPGLSHWVYMAESDWVDRASTMVRPAPELEEIVFLGIDEKSLTLSSLDENVILDSEVLQLMRKRFPWNRRVWAAVVDRLGEAGASQIVLDVLLTEPSEDSLADTALGEAIARHREKIVLASVWQPGVVDERGAQTTSLKEPDPEFIGSEEGGWTEFGFVNFWRHDDGIIREATYRLSMRELDGMGRHPDEETAGDVHESLAAVVARRMGALPVDGSRRMRLAIRGKSVDGRKSRRADEAYPPISLHEIFVDWETKFGGGKFFKDKVVIVGPAAQQSQDIHPTLSGQIFGAQLHAQAIGCLVSGSFLHEAPDYWHWVGLLGMALIGGLLVIWVRHPLWVVLLSVAVVGVWLVCVVYIANQTSILTGGVSGVLGLGFVVTFGQSFEFLQARLERNRLFGQLSRSVSKDVATAMVRSPDGYIDSAKGGRRRIVVLFSDIRGFTKRSESENPETLVPQLNEYLTRMVEIIFAHGGTLDKFIGDAIMATWGGLEDTRGEVMAEAAVKAAVEMCEELERLNAKWEMEERKPFEAGIGIHIGDAMVGEVGSRQRSDFTAIGDAVNLASRIEGMTKMLGVQILVSGQIADLQSDRRGLCNLGRFQVKGRSEPVEVVAAGIEDDQAFRKALEQMLTGDVVTAKGVLLELSGDSSVSGPAKFYQQQEVWEQVSEEHWDGVIKLDSK